MFSNLFIDRPIFAAVISILIVLAGILAIRALPIAQYPPITPPTVVVSANYPGANARVVEQTVATPIEEQVNGAQDMLYMQSTNTNTGQMSLTVTFSLKRNLDLAAVDVQNRLTVAEPELPSEVTREGIIVRKQSTNIVMLIALTSPNNTYDTLFMSNYAMIHMVDTLARVPGVGNVSVFGVGEYAMRIWLNPDRLAQLGLTATDVINAINQQNVQAPAGQIGEPPSPKGQQFQYTVQVQGRLASVQQFENIIVRANPDGSFVHVGDLGRVELGAATYDSFSRLNGQPAVMIGVYQLPDANALDVSKAVRVSLSSLASQFPPGIAYQVPLDRTAFVDASIREVLFTLAIAFALVFLVVYVFLQNWRATLVPAVAVPVSLIGATGAFELMGFSVNTLTLFGLVLAIGLVVDDAIVVVEAAQRHIEEEGVSAKEAAKRGMAEVSGPVIAVALVLTAVFGPVGFLGGITGELYKQLAFTLAIAVLISAFEALTLSPALCAILLKPAVRHRGPAGWFFRGFNYVFGKTTAGYESTVRAALSRKFIILLLLGLIVFGAVEINNALPTTFVPLEDQGYFLVSVQLPNAASLERTSAVVSQVEGILHSTPGIQYVVTIGGFSVLASGSGSNLATAFVMLKPWSERTTPQTSLNGIIASVQHRFSAIPAAVIMSFNPPPIPGLGATGGFQFELENRAGTSITDLANTANRLIAAAQHDPALSGVFTTFRADVPQIQVNVDRPKVITLGVPLTDVFNTLQTYLGGLYVNDLNLFGRVYHVMVQAASQYRASASDIDRYYVRGTSGNMVPLSTLTTTSSITGPDVINRYNLFESIEINGAAAPGYSSGQAIAAMEKTAASVLPRGYGYDWTGLAYQEVTSRGQAPLVLGLAIVFVFLLLAALYESWSVPLAVILIVPLGIFGALVGTLARGLQNDVYAQIGLVMVVGLAAKNAILIVEFAKVRYEHGDSIRHAAFEGARIRFRPILMTSFAFIFGVLPLVIATGAGSAARHSLGTSVLGGMIAATILGVLFVPTFFALIEELPWKRSHREE